MAIDRETGSFEIGIESDEQLETALSNIITGSEKFINTVDSLRTYFNGPDKPWIGADAEELKRVVTQKSEENGKKGVLEKIGEYSQHIASLKVLAEELGNGIYKAQDAIKNNITNKMDV